MDSGQCFTSDLANDVHQPPPRELLSSHQKQVRLIIHLAPPAVHSQEYPEPLAEIPEEFRASCSYAQPEDSFSIDDQLPDDTLMKPETRSPSNSRADKGKGILVEIEPDPPAAMAIPMIQQQPGKRKGVPVPESGATRKSKGKAPPEYYEAKKMYPDVDRCWCRSCERVVDARLADFNNTRSGVYKYDQPRYQCPECNHKFRHLGKSIRHRGPNKKKTRLE